MTVLLLLLGVVGTGALSVVIFSAWSWWAAERRWQRDPWRSALRELGRAYRGRR